MPNTTYGGVYYPAPTGVPANVPAEILKLANSVRGYGNFASEAAAESARASLPSGDRPLAHVQDKGIQYWTGSAWEWVTDPPVPITYQSAFGVSTDFNSANPTWTTYAGYGFTFTPTRTGYADIFCDWDAQQSGAFTGWGSATFRVLLNGILVDQAPTIIFESAPSRDSGRTPMRIRRKLFDGVPATLTMQVQNSSNGGLWHFNSFSWFVAQQ